MQGTYETGPILGLVPGSGRSPGEGNCNPLQYSCLEHSMDKGTWQATWGHKEKDTTDQLPLSLMQMDTRWWESGFSPLKRKMVGKQGGSLG